MGTELVRRCTALVTNDDGIDSPGLAALAAAALRADLHVVVAAPARQSSGASAGLIATTQAPAARGHPTVTALESVCEASEPVLLEWLASAVQTIA